MDELAGDFYIEFEELLAKYRDAGWSLSRIKFEVTESMQAYFSDTYTAAYASAKEVE